MTKNDFLQWKDNPATKEVFEILRATQSAYKNELVGLAGAGETVASAKAAGAIEAFDYLLNIEYVPEGEE